MTEAEVRANNVVTIGELERLAGIEDREAFWAPFARLPGDEGLEAGVRDLRRMVAARETA